MQMVGQRAAFMAPTNLRQPFIWASAAATGLDDMKCGPKTQRAV